MTVVIVMYEGFVGACFFVEMWEKWQCPQTLFFSDPSPPPPVRAQSHGRPEWALTSLGVRRPGQAVSDMPARSVPSWGWPTRQRVAEGDWQQAVCKFAEIPNGKKLVGLKTKQVLLTNLSRLVRRPFSESV